MTPDPVTRHRLRNGAQAVLLLGGMALLLAAVGWFVAGMVGIAGFVVAGTAFLLFSPRVSPRLILRMYGARPLSSGEAPNLARLVNVLSRAAGVARAPALYYIPSALMNAFSVGGRDDASIAVTDGILRGLSSRELTAVLAHEISHIRHNDIWIMGMADSVSRFVWMVSTVGQLLLLINLPVYLAGGRALPWIPILLLVAAPTLSALLQLGLSRNREFDADVTAARITGDPEGLAMALERLERAQSGLFERIFLPRRRDPQPSLLRTHPATEARIERLRQMAREPEPAPELSGFVMPEDWPAVTRPPRRRWTGVWY